MGSWRPQQLVRLLVLVIAALAIGAAGPGFAPAAAEQPPRSTAKRTLHLRLRGDLDCTKLVRDVAAELARARNDGVEFLLLELDGDRWRADVVWGIAQEIRAMRIPVAAWLVDARDRRIGTGQAVLALLVAASPTAGEEADAPLAPAPIYIDPRATIELNPGSDLRDTAPEGTDWGTIDRELQGAAWRALRLRGVDTELAAAMLAPTDDAWAVTDEGAPRPRLTMERPPLDSAAIPVVTRAPALETVSVRLDAALAIRMGFAAGPARSPGDLLSAMRVTAAPRSTREVASGLGKAREVVSARLAAVDRALERADQILRDVPYRSAPDYHHKRKKAGEAALQALDGAANAILDAEELIADYPELLRSSPPSRTSVGERPEFFRDQWRRLFQEKRDEYSRLAARAREYAGR